jgi:hypothetical protein
MKMNDTAGTNKMGRRVIRQMKRGLCECGEIGRTLKDPDPSPVVDAGVHLVTLSIESAFTDEITNNGMLLCGLERHTWLLGRCVLIVQVYASRDAHCQVLFLSRRLRHGGRSAES